MESLEKRSVVVAATFTAEPLAASVSYWAEQLDLPIDVSFAGYGQVFQELLDPASLLSGTRAGLAVVALRLEDWGLGSADASAAGLGAKLGDFVAAATTAAGRLRVPLLVMVCPHTIDDEHVRARAAAAEASLIDGLASLSGVRIVLPGELVETYGEEVVSHPRPNGATHGHIPYSDAVFAALGTEIVRTLRAAETQPFKVLVLDCDQTLWSGVVGEDGPTGVVVDGPRRALQEFALKQRREGVLLCLCTKNAEPDVLATLQDHPDMLVRPEHLTATRVNWEPKSANLRSLAAELNVGLASIVLLDDNPLECAEVAANCPEVVALTLPPDPDDIPSYLANVWVFDRLGTTTEDTRRAEFYEQSAARETLQASSMSFADFIESLGLEVRLFAPADEQMPRIAQLTQRTNQFNNTTIRRTELDIERGLETGAFECVAVEVRDRFGDYGLVGAALHEPRDDALWVETLLMSCRALGRGVEHRMLARVGEIALERGLRRVRIPFAQTERNQPMLHFLRELDAHESPDDRAERNGDSWTVFELTAEVASAVVLDTSTSRDGQPDAPSSETGPSGAPSSLFGLTADQFTKVAEVSRSAAQLAEAVASSVRRRPDDAKAEYVAPRSALEETLADHWARALRVDRVGVHDDFFELGGSSLDAAVLVNRLQEALDARFDSIVVFEAPTVASLAERLLSRPQAPDQVRWEPPAPSGAQSGPLSFAQQRLWFLDQFTPDSTVYNERRAIRLTGGVQLDALEQAIQGLLARHDSLRTIFPATDGRPEQVVTPPSELAFPVADVSALPETEREAEAARIVSEVAARPFDLTTGTLFRAGLVRLAEDDHVLWFVFHHIVADGLSVGVLLQELGALYRSIVGLDVELPASIQYLDFTAHQRGFLSDSEVQSQRDYWRARLADLPTLELPIDHPRPSVLTYRGSSAPVAVPPDLVEALRAVGRRQGATLFMTLMAAFDVLLAQYTRQDDVVVGFPIANRMAAGAESLVGFLVNTLPLRVDLSGNPSFDETLRRVRERATEAYANQDVPFEQLVDDVLPERDLARTPIFSAMLALLDDPVARLELPGVSAESLDVPAVTARFDLVLNLEEGAAGLRGSLEYSTDLFDRETAERMARHLHTLLRSIAGSPSTSILELPFLADEEQAQLHTWAGGSATFETASSLHSRFEGVAASTPEAVAALFDGEALRYEELNARANQLAHRLRRLGVGPDVLVGLCLDRSLDLVVGILGILKAGGAYVPLDPAYPPDRLALLLEDAAVSVVVTQDERRTALAGHDATLVLLDTEAEELRAENAENPSVGVVPENLAYVIYTSGSTGTPKGVPVSHGNVLRLLDATDDWYGFGADDVWTLFHSFAFDFSVWELWGALLYGGRLVVVPYWVSRSPEAFHELLRREGVTVLNQTPSAFRQLIQADRASGADPGEMQLRYVVFGGEALDLQGLRPWFERYGDSTPQLVNMYGITETTVHVTYRPIAASDLDSGAGSVLGQPIPDLELYLLNDAQQLVPIGVPGEICVGGAGVARGYLNRPELTSERFIPNPFGGTEGGRLYRSGDLARRLQDGDLEYLGRIDHQVKIRGFRIELGEIESTISTHPAVEECVVMVRDDLRGGDRRLVAYVVADASRESVVDELADLLRSRLPEYMVPHHVVRLNALPLTPNGKVDRKALPAPEVARADLSRPYVAPRTAVERTMAEIWSAVLGVDDVGVDDNFFELGGDSILSIQVVARCRAAGLNVSPRNLFEHPTISALAETVRAVSPLAVPDHRPASGSVPLTPIQHWFFEQGFEAPSHWNQSFAFEVPADIDVDVLEEALRHVVSHHDALQLRFRNTGDAWQQEYGSPPTSVPITRIDLASVPESARTEALTSRAAALQTRLDIADGPLVRALHADLGPDVPGRLVLAIHHLAVDGVSWRILLEDLEPAYLSLREGREVMLPPRSTSYQRWSEALAAYGADPSVKDTLDWWKDASDEDSVALPIDHAEEDNVEEAARTHTVALGAAETRLLLQRLPAVYGTEINDALLTALTLALARRTSRSSFVVELEGHGREDLFEDVDLSRTVGWFTTIFPFRLEAVSDDATATLMATKERARSTPHRGLSYGLLRYLGDDGSRAALAQPQPDVILNYLGQFDQVVAGSKLFTFAPESSGPWHAPRARRRHALEVLTLVREGKLEARFVFSDALHDERTIAQVADAFVEGLRELVARSGEATSRRFTPSDFPLARLDLAAVDRISEAYPGLDDVYPLSPMQRLFYAMHETQTSVGVEDWRFEIRGALEPDVLRRAWEHVVARHPMLRTAFTERAGGSPLQVVEKDVAVPWSEEDLRDADPALQEARIAALVEQEQARGFDLSTAPLLQLVLVRLADDHWDLLWFTHHLYIDGWSWRIVFDDLRASYEALAAGADPSLGAPFPYSRYIEWLAERPTSDAEAFWKAELAGMQEPTALDLGLASADGSNGEPETLVLSEKDTDRLRALARKQQVTLSSVVQASWSLLLWHYADSTDLVFGAAFSGRPAELAGVDGLVGPCVNNVPVRVHIAETDTLTQLAAQLQARQAELIGHQYDSLADVQRWAAIALRQRLFDSLVVFQNYVVDDSTTKLGGARVDLLVGPDATNYPVTLVAVPRRELRLKLHARPELVSPGQGRAMIEDLATVLAAFVEDPAATLGDVRGRLPAERRGRAADMALHRQPRAVAYVAPAGEMEEVVARIWRELFQVDQIGMDDNFFDLGGHSLLLVRAHERLVHEVRPDLPVSALFQYPTARSLARHLSGAEDTSAARGARERAGRQKEALARLKSARSGR